MRISYSNLKGWLKLCSFSFDSIDSCAVYTSLILFVKSLVFPLFFVFFFRWFWPKNSWTRPKSWGMIIISDTWLTKVFKSVLYLYFWHFDIFKEFKRFEENIILCQQKHHGDASPNPFVSLLSGIGILGSGVLGALYTLALKGKATSDATIESVSTINVSKQISVWLLGSYKLTKKSIRTLTLWKLLLANKCSFTLHELL